MGNTLIGRGQVYHSRWFLSEELCALSMGFLVCYNLIICRLFIFSLGFCLLSPLVHYSERRGQLVVPTQKRLVRTISSLIYTLSVLFTFQTFIEESCHMPRTLYKGRHNTVKPYFIRLQYSLILNNSCSSYNSSTSQWCKTNKHSIETVF